MEAEMTTGTMLRRQVTTLALAGALATLGAAAAAQSVTLRAGTFLPPADTFWYPPIQQFMDDVNAAGKAHNLQISMTSAGGRGVSPFEMGNAVKTGVLDLVHLAGTYYNRLMPIADAQKASTVPVAEQRRNGAFDTLRPIYAQNMNVHYLGRWADHVPFHFYLNKPITGADLKGLRIRGTSVYQAFIEAMGGTMITTPPGEAYTAIERGVVDGYGWPLWGIEAWGWEKVTKYRVEPGFYWAEISVLVNQDVWKKMSAAQQKVLNDAQLKLEADFEKIRAANNARALEIQTRAGIQPIVLPEAEREKFLRLAQEAAWADVIKKEPQLGPRIKQLTTK
jgi:TRAP-type C4-dicarboxylate transport system substrate-binding protein